MTWNDRPQAGERWRRVQTCHKETRTVTDRNLGGDVFYISGAVTRHAQVHQVTEAAWLRWQKNAKEINVSAEDPSTEPIYTSDVLNIERVREGWSGHGHCIEARYSATGEGNCPEGQLYLVHIGSVSPGRTCSYTHRLCKHHFEMFLRHFRWAGIAIDLD